MSLNKALQMDPPVSRFIYHHVTEYSATQGSSNFSSGHRPGMDTARQLLALEQGTRSLEGFIQEYLAIAHYSDLPDYALIDFFCEGVNQLLKSRLIREALRSSLEQFLDYALLCVGSSFTVGVKEEERDIAVGIAARSSPPQAPGHTAIMIAILVLKPDRKLAAAPEHAYVMAATTEPLLKMAAAPERAHVMAATAEPIHKMAVKTVLRHVTAATPEPSKAKAVFPKSSQVTAATPEPSKAKAVFPNSSQVTAVVPESSQVTVDLHEPSQVTAVVPGSSLVSPGRPESSQVTSRLVSTSQVKSQLISTNQSKSQLVFTNQVKTQLISTNQVRGGSLRCRTSGDGSINCGILSSCDAPRSFPGGGGRGCGTS
ncbi:Zinc finger protein sdc-3 [Labeo rohita]|uniref:Zinc finger protein sdc-3 n=1 Tax=Labeo rohita TaxID=84645 RepID=A0ABQ8L543_LABRO|nr:Zinc finger protein sdc-3 [Labeo rohita]